MTAVQMSAVGGFSHSSITALAGVSPQTGRLSTVLKDHDVCLACSDCPDPVGLRCTVLSSLDQP